MGVGIRHSNGDYVIFNGNQTGALLLEYILSTMKEKGLMPENPVMFNTIVTSDIGEAVARKEPSQELDELFDDLLKDTHNQIEKEVNSDEIDASKRLMIPLSAWVK